MLAMATLDSVASQLAGQPVQIACDSPAEDGGYILFDGWIHLQPGVCFRLQHPMGNAWGLGTSALLLEHEIQHIVLDSGDEGDVECHAITNVRTAIAALFAFPVRYAEKAAYAAYQFHDMLPWNYRTQC